jgi:hypothetical protein
LRPIARDRRKLKELVNNLCSWWNNGLCYYYLMLMFHLNRNDSTQVLMC